jgi:hypothetical protein
VHELLLRTSRNAGERTTLGRKQSGDARALAQSHPAAQNGPPPQQNHNSMYVSVVSIGLRISGLIVSRRK